MRYALICNNQVVNVIEWDGEQEYLPADDCIAVLCPEDVSVGWSVTSDGWLAPPEPPEEPAPEPYEDPTVIEAKNDALSELIAFGVTPATARIIVGLPPA